MNGCSASVEGGWRICEGGEEEDPKKIFGVRQRRRAIFRHFSRKKNFENKKSKEIEKNVEKSFSEKKFTIKFDEKKCSAKNEFGAKPTLS